MRELEIRTMENIKQEVKKGEVLQNGLRNRYKCWSDKNKYRATVKLNPSKLKKRTTRYSRKYQVFKIKPRISNKKLVHIMYLYDQGFFCNVYCFIPMLLGKWIFKKKSSMQYITI